MQILAADVVHLSAVSSVMLPPARSSSMACTVSSYSRRAADSSIRRCAWVIFSCMADDCGCDYLAVTVFPRPAEGANTVTGEG
jgi:hypothetical protein